MNIYVAASWRTRLHPEVVAWLRHAGHTVYDFRNPAPENCGFGWRQLDVGWDGSPVAPDEYRRVMTADHPVVVRGFAYDRAALAGCDVCVLVVPSGPSAHVEAGWAAGRGKPVILYISEPTTPDLMHLLLSPKEGWITSLGQLLDAVDALDARRRQG